VPTAVAGASAMAIDERSRQAQASLNGEEVIVGDEK